jgi:hypothetical protein
MFSFTNGLWGVGRGTGSRSGTQVEGQRGDNQSLKFWQIQGMGEAPRDLSVSRGTTGLGDSGRYSFGKDAGQQGTGSGLGFALPEYGNQGFTQAAASGTTAEMGFPNLWASQATGTGMTGLGLTQLATGNLGAGPPSAWGAMESAGPGQWARPTTGTGISEIREAGKPSHREQPRRAAWCKGQARKIRAAVKPPHQEQPKREARFKGRAPQQAREPMWRGYKARGLSPHMTTSTASSHLGR